MGWRLERNLGGSRRNQRPIPNKWIRQKTIHLETDAATDYTIQVDPIGDGSWKDYDTVSFGGAGYDAYIMTGDAVWVRVKSSDAVTATAWFEVS